MIACSCVLTNCDMLLTFGYVLVALGSAWLAEMTSPGSQHRAGTLVLSLISVSKNVCCGASHIRFVLMKLSEPSLIKQCSADKGSTSNKRDGNSRGQSYRTRIM
jgi:hypothetical protein